ncbi:hypothetical protein AYI68_g6370, partial [Smittium mucronatum]
MDSLRDENESLENALQRSLDRLKSSFEAIFLKYETEFPNDQVINVYTQQVLSDDEDENGVDLPFSPDHKLLKESKGSSRDTDPSESGLEGCDADPTHAKPALNPDYRLLNASSTLGKSSSDPHRRVGGSDKLLKEKVAVVAVSADRGFAFDDSDADADLSGFEETERSLPLIRRPRF